MDKYTGRHKPAGRKRAGFPNRFHELRSKTPGIAREGGRQEGHRIIAYLKVDVESHHE